MDGRPVRKRNRLKGFDYSENGAFFVTVCTKKRMCLLWKQDVGAHSVRPPEKIPLSASGAADVVGAHSVRPPEKIPLSASGAAVEYAIQQIGASHPGIQVENYVIMPNHIHLLLRLSQYKDGRTECAPTTVSNIVRYLKSIVTRRLGYCIWQRSFHDHIIRNQADYNRIYSYIDTNPVRWKQDCLFQDYKEEPN